MTDLYKQLQFFIDSRYTFSVKHNTEKGYTEIWVDGYVYCYAYMTEEFKCKMTEELYEKQK